MKQKRINDRYQLLRPIGGGGMADVYLAHDIILDRDVAVKVLKPQFSEDEDFIKRFRREAQAATSLSHPNVVNIFDVGEEDNLYFIVMEYIKGSTLKDFIQQKGKLHVHEAVKIMEQITSAIEHAHENHIIHRDIKPHNILISEDGKAKVTDFGIARAISEATITHTNSILGSVHYLSPEQARGGNVTYKSDIYSLGIVMYEMLTGKVPFNGDTAVSVAIKHLQEPLPFLTDVDPTIPQSVENVVLKSTAKDPLERFATADNMLEDLVTVFDPIRKNEKRVEINNIDEEATKAVPIIKQQQGEDLNQTIVRGEADQTKWVEPPEKKKKGKKFWFITIFASLFFIFAVFFVAFSMIPRWLHVEDVVIPDDLIGKEYEIAYEELTELGLIVEQDLRPDDEVEEGLVISHRPLAGQTVKVGTEITLVVSEGPDPIGMIDVIGEAKSHAERLLEQYEGIEFDYEETTEYEDDIVLEQSPEPGELIFPNETVVTLTLSKRPTYTITNLYGMTRDEVISILSENTLLDMKLEDEHHPTIEEGRVISQDPPRGTEIRERTEVTVVFSLGPEPEEEEPEEVPITVHVPFRVEVEDTGSNGEESDPFHVVIQVIDMMHTVPSVVIDKEIRETESFRIPLTVAPGDSGYLLVYINGEEYEDSAYEYTYEELKGYQ
ncbi:MULTISPECIES: Stk1 family PASTA domain-containing Ser/Thr kinase [Bacillaceae]|uniref:non-specific serine/threonine protein kinase n=1 Tax=Evansella alkalicola TaxID=745819 RepID=A0ABS6JQ56_9BACI|nr:MULTISPECIES: Stk1 family PASTA domain-containing Ser/Thr kinase [Bacillaceae]MBU9720397.1 Stk1 family PASTA domain-containing Ser/Thr kinase [Bacillus alkalicola]